MEKAFDERAERRPLRLFAKLLRLLRWFVLIVFTLGCVAVFYIAVVMGEVPEQQQAETLEAATPMPPPPPLPGAARSIESVDLAQLQALFPAHLATLPAGQNFLLVSGRVEDTRVSGGRMCRRPRIRSGWRRFCMPGRSCCLSRARPRRRFWRAAFRNRLHRRCRRVFCSCIRIWL